MSECQQMWEGKKINLDSPEPRGTWTLSTNVPLIFGPVKLLPAMGNTVRVPRRSWPDGNRTCQSEVDGKKI